LPFGTVRSVEAFAGHGKQTTNSLGLASEYALEQGNYEQAIKLCKRALDKGYDDMDTHMAYANALEAKLNAQEKQDVELLNECVREWLIVFRTEVGDEKGISFHGISPLGHFYEDEERSIPARAHIVTLTGRAPRPWETDEKFMKWVNRPKTEVAGRLISHKTSNTKSASKTTDPEQENTASIRVAIPPKTTPTDENTDDQK